MTANSRVLPFLRPRNVVGISAVAVLLSACGHHAAHATPRAAAIIDGQTIAQSDVDRYLSYTSHFYSNASTGGSAPLSCTSASSSWSCLVVRRQVIGRLLQERVILAYAQQHHVELSTADQQRVDAAMRDPKMQDTPDKEFLRTVVEREMLVQRVEDAVMPLSATQGPSVHVIKYSIPLSSGSKPRDVAQQALDLATDGKPVPKNATVRAEWVAQFHLAPALRSALRYAEPHQFVGPFRTSRGYLVVQLLGRGVHKYGEPARVAKASAFFRWWVNRAVHRARPACFDAGGRNVPCPLA